VAAKDASQSINDRGVTKEVAAQWNAQAAATFGGLLKASRYLPVGPLPPRPAEASCRVAPARQRPWLLGRAPSRLSLSISRA
jgi:hypothetical protein